MRSFDGKRYWLVGASEGLGEALARKMAGTGAHLILSARSESRLNDLAADLSCPCDVRPLDVADDASVLSAVDTVGPVDGVVFLAGVYWPMSAVQWSREKAIWMADVNFTGCLRVLGSVVPSMVARNSGHIVITGSLAGFRGLPGSIGYAASKAAVMSLAECLYADLRTTGVVVQVVNPGFIQTRLTDKNHFRMPFILQPDDAAGRMLAHMRTDTFKVSFPRGFSWLFRLSQFMPDWMYYRLFS
ncbi:MAG: SDR family NAD(P)-dependent oxidoreductase [Aestuariivita sp.]|nr:SDR family NAD(P)-dependent oxidoreductase [Aestuariivita sp.]